MRNIRSIALAKYQDDTKYERIDEHMYRDPTTGDCFMTIRWDMEDGEDNQYPLEDILDRYTICCTDHIITIDGQPAVLEVELASYEEPYGEPALAYLTRAQEILGKRVYNKPNGEYVSLVIEPQ